MEKPSPATAAYYDAAVPPDPRATKGAMFGHPCAFVNGNMFFGTFGQTVVARVGEARASTLARGKLRSFEPMAGRAWKEYVQVDAGALPAREIATLAREALEWAAALPAKVARKKASGTKAPRKRATKAS